MKRDLPAYVYPKGRKGYLYFTRGGKTTRMHSEPGTAAFAAEYARLLRGEDLARARTFKRLIASYTKSDAFARLSPVTQRDYRKHMRYFEEAAGAIDPTTMRRVNVIQMRDALSETPTQANRRLGFLKVLLEHAIDIGWMKDNPAKGVRNLPPTGRERHPWPQDLIDAFRDEADEDTRLVFELLLGTGQRIADVLKMQWGHIDGDGINVRQSKTKTPLWIPFTASLRHRLAQTPRRSLYIVSQANGRPWSYQLAWKRIMDVRKVIGAEAYDIHALRYNAASEIAELGFSDEFIASITGHLTTAMIHKYSGPARQRARASEAQRRRDGGSKDTS